MASDIDFVVYVVEQISSPYPIRYRKMFGEYALYCNDKVVGLICDNNLYIKITSTGKQFVDKMGDVELAPAYPGAKPSFLLSEQLENSEWLSELILITESALPFPAPKKPKKPKK